MVELCMLLRSGQLEQDVRLNIPYRTGILSVLDWIPLECWAAQATRRIQTLLVQKWRPESVSLQQLPWLTWTLAGKAPAWGWSLFLAPLFIITLLKLKVLVKGWKDDRSKCPRSAAPHTRGLATVRSRERLTFFTTTVMSTVRPFLNSIFTRVLTNWLTVATNT